MRKLAAWILALALAAALCPAAAEDGIPVPSATAAFPAGASREVHVENPGARRISFRHEAAPYRLEAYVLSDSTAHLRVEIPAGDNPCAMVVCDANTGELHALPALLNADRSAYVLDLPMPAAEDASHAAHVRLYALPDPDDPGLVDVYLIPGEEYLDELCGCLLPFGWEPGGEEDGAPAAPEAPQAYVLHVTDPYGDPVPGVYATFCTDTACFMAESDGEGIIRFDGAPDVYHVQLIKVPEGYGFDADFELRTGPAYSEWRLFIRKD